jgi:thiol-disulfide isomerase/thioredoxin
MKNKNSARRTFGAFAVMVLSAGVLGGCGGQNASQSAAVPSAAAPQESGEKLAATTSEPKAVAPAGRAQPAKATGGTQTSVKGAGAKGIAWATSFEAARAQAKTQNKVIMIDFYTDWCSACKLLDAEIYPDAEVVKASRNFVNVKVNAEQRTDIAQQYGVTAFPTILWIRADGVPVLRQDGVSSQTSDFVALMKNAHARFTALVI